MFFEQAGQHGRVWLGVGTTSPSLRLRELDYALAHSERSHVIAMSRDEGASLAFWHWALGVEELKRREVEGWLVGELFSNGAHLSELGTLKSQFSYALAVRF